MSHNPRAINYQTSITVEQVESLGVIRIHNEAKGVVRAQHPTRY